METFEIKKIVKCERPCILSHIFCQIESDKVKQVFVQDCSFVVPKRYLQARGSWLPVLPQSLSNF